MGICHYIYIYIISCHLCFDQQTGGHFTKDKEMMLLCHALPCFAMLWIPWFGDFVRGWHLCRGPHTFRGIECCCWLAIMASRGVRTVPISHILAIYEQYGWLMMVNDGWLTIWWWMMVNDGEWWLYIIYILIMVNDINNRIYHELWLVNDGYSMLIWWMVGGRKTLRFINASIYIAIDCFCHWK